jgi:hypothetical protein
VFRYCLQPKRADFESLSDYHGRGAFRVVIHYGIDSSAHGIAARQPGIIGLKQSGRRADIIHAGVEPGRSHLDRG